MSNIKFVQSYRLDINTKNLLDNTIKLENTFYSELPEQILYNYHIFEKNYYQYKKHENYTIVKCTKKYTDSNYKIISGETIFHTIENVHTIYRYTFIFD